MEKVEKQSEDTLQSFFAEAEVDDVKDFSHFIETTEDIHNSPELEQKSLSNIDKALHQVEEEEKKYIKVFEEYYAAVSINPQKPHEKYEFLTQPSVFYKSLMDLGGEASHKLHGHIQMFLSDTDAKKQQVARQRIITSYWNFYETVIENIKDEISDYLLFMIRYGIVISSLVSKEVLSVISNIDIKARNDTTFYYVDEWLQAVSSGELTQSVLDEHAVPNTGVNIMAIKQKIENIQRQQEQKINLCQSINSEIQQIFEQVKATIEKVEDIRTNDSEFNFSLPYSSTELQEFKKIHEILRTIASKNSQLEVQYNSVLYNKKTLDSLTEEAASLHAKKDSSNAEQLQIHKSVIVEELNVIRQMCKLCVGSRGNHFPILYKNYFNSAFKDMGYKEQVIRVFKEIESVDFTLFQRIIKSNVIRNAPIVLLVPCYGQMGFCWEPFEKRQRNTSSAKLVIPMYSRDLQSAILYAAGDYRWQIAKELSGQFWMKEGLTGWYFQWFDTAIRRGDIKKKFIEDYMLWMKWEQNGVQKLSKEVREIFWRFIPFIRKIKNKLVKMVPVYAELSKKEHNRYISDLV